MSLRDVVEADLELFFEQQLDPDAGRMAAFPARNRDDFYAHWHKIIADDTVVMKAILLDRDVAGNVVMWSTETGERDVGYWIGKPYWGKGVATAALARFLELVTDRPLHAHVAKGNQGSIKVLEKCGFVVESEVTEGDLDELVMILA